MAIRMRGGGVSFFLIISNIIGVSNMILRFEMTIFNI